MININNYNRIYIDSTALRIGERLDNIMHDILPQLKQSGGKISVGYPTKRFLEALGKESGVVGYSGRMATQNLFPFHYLGYLEYVGDENFSDEHEFLLNTARECADNKEKTLFIMQNSELSKQLYEIKNGAKNGKNHLIDIFFISNQSTLEEFVEQKV